MNIKDIAELSYKLLTPLIAITVALIAYQQYRLSKLNLRIALFDRRNAVFEAIMEFISAIVQNADATTEELHKLLRKTRGKYFLFKEEISLHIDELYRRGTRLQLVRTLLNDQNLPVGDQRTNLANELNELLAFFSGQYDITRNKLKKYLDLGRKP